MLVEPGMLLMYNSVDKSPIMTEKLVEYLSALVNHHDECRTNKFKLSLERVIKDCEMKKVIPSIKYLINHSSLSSDIQLKLKNFYRASELIQEQKKK